MKEILVDGLGKVKIAGDIPTPEENFAISEALKTKFDFPEFQDSIKSRIEPFQGREFAGMESEESRKNQMMLDAVTFPRSIKGKINQLKKINPDVTFGMNPDGNIFLNLDSERFYINKKGVTSQDFADLSVETIFQAPLIAAGAATGAGALGALGRVLGAAAGAGAGSIARDVVTDDDIDSFNAAISAGFAGTFEAFAPMVISGLNRVFTSSRFYKGNELTNEGKDFLKNMGLDPDSVTQEFIKSFNQNVSKAKNAKEAARQSQAESLPVKVPLSKGDLSRNVTDQALESAAERGALGEQAAQQAKTFRQGQQETLLQNVDEIEKTIGTGAPIEQGTGIANAQGTLLKQSDSLRESIRQAYKVAGENKASVLSEGIASLNNHVSNSLKTFNPKTAPKTYGIADDLNSFMKSGDVNVKSVNVQTLENWRQQMSQLSRSNDPVEKAAAGKALKAYDEFFDQYVDEALITGNKTAIESFKEARALRTRLAKDFESDRLLKDIIKTQDGGLTLTPNEALNKLFNVNSLGVKQGANKTLTKVKSLLGETSAEWQQMKQEAFLRLLSSNQKGNIRGEGLERIFSGDKFATAFDDAMKNSSELMNTLFSKSEIQLLQNFKDVALSATNRVPGAVNTSNTTTMNKLLNNSGFIGREIKAVLQGIIERGEAAKVTQAFNQSMKIEPIPGLGGASSIPATKTQQEEK